MKKRSDELPLSNADREFFQDFYDQYKNLLYHEAIACAATTAERDDLVQEAAIRLMKKIPVLRDLTHHKTAYYIVITVRTAYIDMLRCRNSTTALSLDDDSIQNLLYSHAFVQQSEPDAAARIAVLRLKRRLTERDWQILVGKCVMGYTYEELSARLGISPASLRMMLTRAKARARKLLQQEEWAGAYPMERTGRRTADHTA